jgi:hypothetical protein
MISDAVDERFQKMFDLKMDKFRTYGMSFMHVTEGAYINKSWGGKVPTFETSCPSSTFLRGILEISDCLVFIVL